MKIFRFLLLSVVLTLFCSCSTNDIGTKIITEEFETEFAKVSTELLEITYLQDGEFAAKLNKEAEENQEKRVEGFLIDAEQSVDQRPSDAKAELVTKQLVKYAKNDFLSSVEEEYSYIGGAHGMTVWNAQNIDFKLKKQIGLSDLFAEAGYEAVLDRMMQDLVEQKPDEYSELWEQPKISAEHQYNFYITENDLVIYFQPYELSYYARGFVEFPLRLSELKGYLKEEYYFLADNSV